jgi:predicted dehydrogenase
MEKISQGYGIPMERGQADYREAIERTEADIAVITLPTALHKDAALRAIEKGMHVICEKPLATNREEADAIVAGKMGRPKLKFMVCQNYRWRPHNQAIRKAIREGRIGRIGSIRLEFRQPECFIGYREFLPMPLLQDVTIHHFDLIRFFTGKNCERIAATVYRPRWSRYEGKPSAEAILLMEDGVVANYSGTWAARGQETSWDGNIMITGDRGCITLDAKNTVRFHPPDSPQGLLLENAEMAVTELDYALRMFIECVEKDTLPEADLDDNYRSFAMVCAAEESLQRAAFAEVS